MGRIDRFKGQYRCFSNFYPAEVEYDGFLWQTTEHAFQAAKTTSLSERAEIREAETPGRAKRLGKRVRLRPDWEDVKVQVMTDLCRIKFSKEPLRTKLLATGDAELVEGNHWHDTFWGVCSCENCPEGQNHLGKVLMQIREELKT